MRAYARSSAVGVRCLVRLPEGLDDGPRMQCLRVAASDHLHHRAEVAPGFLGDTPVILDPCWRIVDLTEDIASVASAVGTRVERILQLGTLGEVVTQKRLGTGAVIWLGTNKGS